MLSANTVIIVILVLSQAATCNAFRLQAPISRNQQHHLLLHSSTPNNSESSTKTDEYVFPSTQFQQDQLGLRSTINDVATTFAAFREVEAAGMIDESDRIEDVNRKAVEKFASFAQRSKLELDEANKNPTSTSNENELKSALIDTAAVLGRVSAKIFGGDEPENFRN